MGIAMEIRNIWAVGRNYAEHAKELGNAVPEAAGDPMIFLKAGTCAVFSDSSRVGEIPLPEFSKDIHHETELSFRFGPDLELTEMTVGLDLTARDVQETLKSKGHPWTLAKSFRAAAAFGPFVPVPRNLDLQNIDFTLRINGELRQSGNSRDMIHPIAKLRRYVLERFPVVPGDVLMTGTPKGVSRLVSGDRLDAEIQGLVKTSWTVR